MILAVDIGTSSCKGCGFDATSLLPLTHWVRRDYNGNGTSPRVWYETCLSILQTIAEEAKSMNTTPTLIVLSGMMQNVILPKEDDKCIMYNDAAFALKAHEYMVKKGFAKKLRNLTGNYKESASVAAKLMQLKRELKPSKSPISVLFGSHSYVAWRLLNIGDEGLMCDPTTASTTGLVDQTRKQWLTAQQMKEFGLDQFMLPRLLPNASRIVGHVHLNHDPTEMLNGLPLVHGSGDLGSLISAVDRWGFSTHAYLGTSGWIAKVVPRQVSHRPEVFVLAHPLDEKKAVHAMPTTSAGLNASKWAVTLFDKDLSHFDARAETIVSQRSPPALDHSVLYLPHLKGERAPIPMSHARAGFVGMTPETTREEMAYAVLTGVAYQFRWLWESFEENSASTPTRSNLCLLGGGSRSAVWKQIFADVMRAPIKSLKGRSEEDETVWGAACIGQHALFQSSPSLASSRKETSEMFPEAMWMTHKPRDAFARQHDQLFPAWLEAVLAMQDILSIQSKAKL